MNAPDLSVEALARLYIQAKLSEAEAIATRRRLGALIEDAIPGPGEGTVSTKIDGMKVTVTRKVTRKVDTDSLSLLWGNLSPEIQKCFRWAAEVNTKELRALEDAAEAAQFITTTPAATSVSVEVINQPS